jgi:hypothetical protein
MWSASRKYWFGLAIVFCSTGQLGNRSLKRILENVVSEVRGKASQQIEKRRMKSRADMF